MDRDFNNDYVDWTSIKRFLYFYAETAVGLSIIIAMVTISLSAGTWLIGSYGDPGGFVWCAGTYVMFLCFDPVYEKLKQKMRKYLD